MLPTPVNLRERSKIYLDAAHTALSAEAKRQLAAYAFTLAQVAECMERDIAYERVDELGGVLAEALQMALRVAPSELRAIADAAIQRSIAQDRNRIKRWRIRAEELRATADQFCVPSAQTSLRRAAANYEQLADDAEARLTRQPPLVREAIG
jgi:hypothetical protein